MKMHRWSDAREVFSRNVAKQREFSRVLFSRKNHRSFAKLAVILGLVVLVVVSLNRNTYAVDPPIMGLSINPVYEGKGGKITGKIDSADNYDNNEYKDEYKGCFVQVRVGGEGGIPYQSTNYTEILEAGAYLSSISGLKPGGSWEVKLPSEVFLIKDQQVTAQLLCYSKSSFEANNDNPSYSTPAPLPSVTILPANDNPDAPPQPSTDNPSDPSDWKTIYTMANYDDQLRAVIYTAFFRSCANSAGYLIESNRSQTGKWFDGSTEQIEGFYPLISPENNDKSCQDLDDVIVPAAMRLFGFSDPVRFYDALYFRNVTLTHCGLNNQPVCSSRAIEHFVFGVDPTGSGDGYSDNPWNVLSDIRKDIKYYVMQSAYIKACKPAAINTNITDPEVLQNNPAWQLDFASGEAIGYFPGNDINNTMIGASFVYGGFDEGHTDDDGGGILYETGCKALHNAMKNMSSVASSAIKTNAKYYQPGANNNLLYGNGKVNSSADGAPDSPTCESSGGSMAWILCPVIVAMQGGVNLLMGYITNQLNYQSLNDNHDYVKQAWEKFIPLANIAFVIVFLIVIYSTAIGGKLG